MAGNIIPAVANLKRPSLHPSPLASVPEDGTGAQHQHQVRPLHPCIPPPKGRPDALTTSTNSTLAKLPACGPFVEGGLAKALKLDDSALELDRFEHIHALPNNNAGGKSPEPAADVEAGAPDNESAQPATTATVWNNDARCRFTHLHFRKQSHNWGVSGLALTVVDAAEPVPPQDAKKAVKEEAGHNNPRVTILLAALKQGTEGMQRM